MDAGCWRLLFTIKQHLVQSGGGKSGQVVNLSNDDRIHSNRFPRLRALSSWPSFLSCREYCIRTLPRGGMYWKIHSPRPKRFPKGGNFAPRGPRDCPRAKPEGNLEGRGVQNPHRREISRAEVGVFSNASRLEAVYGHSFRISREVLILWCDNRWL